MGLNIKHLKRESSFVFFFCTLLHQFVVLVICKYHLYIFKKYNIDNDFFKQILFVLSFMQLFVSSDCRDMNGFWLPIKNNLHSSYYF